MLVNTVQVFATFAALMARDLHPPFTNAKSGPATCLTVKGDLRPAEPKALQQPQDEERWVDPDIMSL